jgi:hypothetical protein
MGQTANGNGVFLPNLYSKIEVLPSVLQEEVLHFTDFLISKSKAKLHDAKSNKLDETANDVRFADLSLSSLSKEWDCAEDEEWDTILAQMPPVQ